MATTGRSSALLGDAGPIIAFAAEQLFLHYHDAESVGTGALGESHSDWTPADDHHVVDAF